MKEGTAAPRAGTCPFGRPGMKMKKELTLEEIIEIVLKFYLNRSDDNA